MTAGADWIAVASTISDHHAAMRLELWGQSPPAQPPHTWERRMEAELRFRAGVLQSETVTGPAGAVALPIPTTGTLRVRGYRRGSEAVIAAVQDVHARIDQYELDAVPWPEGVEQFLVQLWPVH